MWSVAFLSLALAVPLAQAAPDPTDPVPPDHWAYTALAKLLGPELDREWHGNRQMTRYEFALGLWRVLESLGNSEQPPGELPAWEASDLLELVIREFGPELSLLSAAADEEGSPGLRDRLASIPEEHWFHSTAGRLLDHLTPFRDVPRDHWAHNAVETLRQKGIIVGYPAGTFSRPGATSSPA